MVPSNYISKNNSSTATLGVSGVFTGTADDVSQFGEIVISIFSNRASATSGVVPQFSSDGTNWDDALPTYTYGASGNFVISIKPERRYFRIVYTNTTLSQTSFRLQTIYKTTPVTGPSQLPGTWGVGLDATNGVTSPVVAPTTIAKLHQFWSSEHPENNSATNDFFPQNQGDLGDLHTSLTTIRGVKPVEVGHGTTEAVAKTFPTNQSGAQRVAQAGGKTASVTSANDSASSAQLIAANTARAALTFHNESDQILYIKYGGTASIAAGGYSVKIAAGALYELPMPVYTGAIHGIWSADSTGYVNITELT